MAQHQIHLSATTLSFRLYHTQLDYLQYYHVNKSSEQVPVLQQKVLLKHIVRFQGFSQFSGLDQVSLFGQSQADGRGDPIVLGALCGCWSLAG